MGVFDRLKQLIRPSSSEDPVRTVHLQLEAASERLREFAVSVNRTESLWLMTQERIGRHEKNIEHSRAQAKQAMESGEEALARQWLEKAHGTIGKLEELKEQANKLNATRLGLKGEYQRMQEQLNEAMRKKERLEERARSAAARREAFRAFAEELGSGPFSAWGKLSDQVMLAEAGNEVSRSPAQRLNEELEQLLQKEKT